MGKTKAFSEKTDYYSMKRKATQDIITWLEQDVPETTIIFNLQKNYGFSKKFYLQTMAMFQEHFDNKAKEDHNGS